MVQAVPKFFKTIFGTYCSPVKMHKVIFAKTFEKVRENKDDEDSDGGDGILHPRERKKNKLLRENQMSVCVYVCVSGG